ncbi:TPA: hypothetical protein VA534_000895 [Streptococcus agalactiae]|nr:MULTISPECIES: hypothetical protein [Streptococcus]QBX07791.1 hypothetical protein JavanS19_0014 [Streptococcus satellite phage Javan19]ASZ02369.1 hypothetical protein CHF17_02136 [Streptococcus agalactiae]EPW13329.1 hypothetical protein SAG0050_02510 [Streptococcus agalactiae CCUG 17336]EPW43686.1 hypothetical protein SAG0074_07435 [Streptococcus agalactiae CCUG 44186]MCC9920980.1 hypothetical protein [Streptococcus agalactiae]
MRSIEELNEIANYILERMTDEEKDNFPNMTREEIKGLIIKYGNSRT